ncbi:MAG TPA: D-hexose-6-phosphate mutarotase [Chthoniobacteraceae bacterium]
MLSAADFRSFEIPGKAMFEAGPGGLVQVVVTTGLAHARIFLHGAHVADFHPAGEEPVLFTSRESVFEPGRAIRGGVPVIFPWFGPRADDPKSPAHGFARTREWQLESVSEKAAGELVVTFTLAADQATRALWPHDFLLRHTVTVGTALEMSLEVTNTGSSSFTFEDALHTYFTVSDVHQVEIHGLEGAEYIDKTDEQKRKRHADDPIRFTSETDRVFLNTETTCTLVDQKLGRRIVVEKSGSVTTVVWNPWIKKSASLADFGDDEWPGMCCIETANAADNAITLAPGASHHTVARIIIKA